MATPLVKERIPCRYVVAKYVDDPIKDEPVNIGVILQSQKDYAVQSKFITDYSKPKLFPASRENIILLEEILKNLEEETSSAFENKKELDSIISKFEGRIKFTEPRGTLVSNLSEESLYLFNRYVTIKQYPEEKNRVSHDFIRKEACSYFDNFGKFKIRTEYLVKGRMSNFRYDIAILERNRYVHTISFDEQYALSRTKLFDWSVKDTVGRYNDLTVKNFIALISKPTLSNQKNKMKAEDYNEGTEILSSSGYPLVQYKTEDNSWKKDLHKLIE